MFGTSDDQLVQVEPDYLPGSLEIALGTESPLEEGASKVSSDHPQLRYINGGHARELLGGLVQFLAWY